MFKCCRQDTHDVSPTDSKVPDITGYLNLMTDGSCGEVMWVSLFSIYYIVHDKCTTNKIIVGGFSNEKRNQKRQNNHYVQRRSI